MRGCASQGPCISCCTVKQEVGAQTCKETDALVCASDVQVVAVAAGEGTCYALTDAGQVFAWGQGSKGQLGTGE